MRTNLSANHSLPLEARHQDEQILLLVPKVAAEHVFARVLRLQVADLDHEPLALLVVLLPEGHELGIVPTRPSASTFDFTEVKVHVRSTDMSSPLARLLLLGVEFLLEYTELRLRLLLRAGGRSTLLLPLCLSLVLLRAQSLQVAPECLSIPPDASEISLERRDSACDVALLGSKACLLCLHALELGRLVGERATEVFDLEHAEIEFVPPVVVRGLGRGVLALETVHLLQRTVSCEQ